jgi:tetratricopeptide (TPR) repeat protein
MNESLRKLSSLDPSDSMEETLEAVEKVLDGLPTDEDERRETLDIIAEKEKAARDYYLRPFDSDSIYRRLSEIHEQMGNNDKAEMYRKCLDMREARNSTILGDSFSLMGINSRAVGHLQNALNLGPADDLVEEIERTLVKAEKRVAKAEDEIEPLMMKLERDPTHKNNLIKAVKHLIDLDRFQEAIHTADRGLDVYKNDPELLFRKGCAYFGMGDREKAMEIFIPLLEVNPNSNNYKRAVNLCRDLPE